MKLTIFIYNLMWFSIFFLSLNGGNKVFGVSQTATEMEADDDCTEVWCENYSFSEVKKMYGGLFLTKFQFLLQQLIFYLDRDVILYHEGVKDFEYIVGSEGDGDSCCVTKQVTHINDTLKNVMGVTRHIVHLTNLQEKRYQFITQAECIGIGKCDGMCVLEDTVRTVLVFDGQSITFDQVLVPSYCSCKRTG